MKCIICLEERPASLEHVFPEAIGGRLEIDRLCTPCNNLLGTSIDVGITDDPLILMARHQHFGDTGALLRSLGPGVLADGTHVFPKMDDAIGALGVDVRGEKHVVENPDGTTTIRYALHPDRESELPKILERERTRLQKKGQTLIGHSVEHVSQEKPESHHNAVIDLAGVTLGLAKIAYEFTWRVLGDNYLDDPTAHRFRAALRAGVPKPDAVQRFPLTDLGGANVKGASAFEPFSDLPPTFHAVGVSREGERVLAGLRVFNIYVAGFEMSGSATNYTNPSSPRVYAIDSVSGQQFEN